MELSDAEMDRIRKEMRQSTRRMEVSDADKIRIREEMSRSFGRHENRDSCDKCDDTFVKKNNLTTTFYQMKDTTSFVSGKSGDMIADLGCPNTVIGRKDVKNFIDNLSEELRDTIEVIKADENFKFGPSGPFKCTEKLRLKINLDEEILLIDVAIVDTNIPMLLGNNLLKTLERWKWFYKTG